MKITFPQFTGIRCLMMPFIQGDPNSVPDTYALYRPLLLKLVIEPGKQGYLTIDESIAEVGRPHRCTGAKFKRAIHTEATRDATGKLGWENPPTRWNDRATLLDPYTQVLLVNNVDDSCAIWPGICKEITTDGDLGHIADQYPYEKAIFIKAGEVHRMTVCTPHEGLPLLQTVKRQFLRIVGVGMTGFASHFTPNPLLA